MGGNLELLLYVVSRLSSATDKFFTTTSIMASNLHISQQTISRKLRDCEAAGLIVRNVTPSGVFLRLTEKGISWLKEHHAVLENLFQEREKSIIGKVKSGLGEGKYYMALDGYKKQFKKLFGFIPFPGTLNLQVDNAESLIFGDKKVIHGFETEERAYGDIDCFNVVLNVKGNKKKLVLIKPKRTTHDKDIIEVVAPYSIRERFSLDDNDEVIIRK